MGIMLGPITHIIQGVTRLCGDVDIDPIVRLSALQQFLSAQPPCLIGSNRQPLLYTIKGNNILNCQISIGYKGLRVSLVNDHPGNGEFHLAVS